MYKHHEPATFISSQDFLEIVSRACRSYSEESASEGFVAFLRDQIFCHLGKVHVEIFFLKTNENLFVPFPSQPASSTQEVSSSVPSHIPSGDPLLTDVFSSNRLVTFNNDSATPSFLRATGNLNHGIFPLSPDNSLKALLYVGCQERIPFPDEYLHGIQTITLLISTWMKSKGVISQLQSSMASLEYSEQLRQALYEISEQAHLATSKKDLFSSLHKIIGRFINAENFFIALREERNGEHFIKFNYYFDEVDSHLQGLEYRIDKNKPPIMTSFIIESGKPLLLGPDNFDRFCQENNIKYMGQGAHSLIGVPFYLDDLAGVVVVQSYREVIYTEKDRDLLAYVARHIGDALERKKTIDDMRNINEIFSLFMRYSPIYLLIKEVTESHNRILQTSDNFTKLIDTSSADIVGKSMTDLYPKDFADQVIASDWEVVASGRPLQMEERYEGRTYTTIKFPISQRGRTLLASYSIDITERKQVEEALRESERKYRIIFEKSPFGVVCFNTEGSVLDFNDKFVETMGSTREKLLGFNALHHGTPLLRETMKKAMAGQIVSSEDFYTSVTGGKSTYLRGIFSPVFPDHSPTEVMATIEDISEQKEHEKEQQKIEKLESLGVLAGGIAHDFNNILTGIMANISFSRILIDPNHAATNPLVEAEKASKRAAELAQQLLTFAKGGEPNKKVISLPKLINEAVSLMLRGSNVRAIVDISDTIHAVDADDGQISQVLNNMIINGAQAMPDGGTIYITAENEFLSKTNSYQLSAGNYIKIILTDEGCGMTAKVKDKIFDPYFTTKIKGTGLGLASAYSIIARHSGHILVDSMIDQGTEFIIYLPSIGTPYTEHQSAVSQENGFLKEGAILVMDDEEMIRDIAESMLTHLGYSVTTCTNGEEAIELYRKSLNSPSPFKAVIVDLTVPGGLGGMEAAEQIHAISASACLIVSSGYSNDPIMANFREYGFSGAIAKPYNIDDFEKILSTLPSH